MRDRMHRVQIRLTPEQHRRLRMLADQQRRSLSDLVRELLDQVLAVHKPFARDVQDRLERIEQAHRIATRVLHERGGLPIEADISALIREIREERFNDLDSSY